MLYYILCGVAIILTIWAAALTFKGGGTANKAMQLEEVVAHLYDGKSLKVEVHEKDTSH